jgi:hypothetical protein
MFVRWFYDFLHHYCRRMWWLLQGGHERCRKTLMKYVSRVGTRAWRDMHTRALERKAAKAARELAEAVALGNQPGEDPDDPPGAETVETDEPVDNPGQASQASQEEEEEEEEDPQQQPEDP